MTSATYPANASTRLVVLDAQGVVFNSPFRGFVTDLAESTGRDPAALWQVWRDELRMPFWQGRITRQRLWARLAPGCDMTTLETDLESRYRPGPLYRYVVSSDTRLWLFTNHRTAWLQPRLERFGLADRFEQVLVSDEIGVAKPRAASFAGLIRRAATEDFCFVDDSQRNVDAATAAGIHAVHVDAAAVCARRTCTDVGTTKGTS